MARKRKLKKACTEERRTQTTHKKGFSHQWPMHSAVLQDEKKSRQGSCFTLVTKSGIRLETSSARWRKLPSEAEAINSDTETDLSEKDEVGRLEFEDGDESSHVEEKVESENSKLCPQGEFPEVTAAKERMKEWYRKKAQEEAAAIAAQKKALEADARKKRQEEHKRKERADAKKRDEEEAIQLKKRKEEAEVHPLIARKRIKIDRYFKCFASRE